MSPVGRRPLPGQQIVTLDIETTGLDPHRDRLVLVQMGFEDETMRG